LCAAAISSALKPPPEAFIEGVADSIAGPAEQDNQ
jgi:hypothetical protein